MLIFERDIYSGLALIMTPVCKSLQPEDFKGKHLMQLIQIVSKIHEAGVLHLDLRPRANILIFNDSLYVVDFGFSQFNGEENTCNAGATVFGSDKMAEMILKETPYEPRCCDDWHSVCKIIYFVSGNKERIHAVNAIDSKNYDIISTFWNKTFSEMPHYKELLTTIDKDNEEATVRAMVEFVRVHVGLLTVR